MASSYKLGITFEYAESKDICFFIYLQPLTKKRLILDLNTKVEVREVCKER
jgi:hypothetical protein